MAGRFFNLESYLGLTILIFIIGFCHGYTNPSDAAAINSLYISFGSPALPGWVASGGDPCAESWQGVDCQGGTSILEIKLIGANLHGELGNGLGAFSSLRSITLSNNLIGGSIPSTLPATLINLFLSDNRLTGSIPNSLSSLSQLKAMSLNNNGLTGPIPDAFQGLASLVNLDLSENSLSGQLPPSMQNLASLTSFHLQNNQLSGTLDNLQNLPIKDLDIRNNLFSGPIPAKLLSIPNFRQEGNPFTAITTPPASSGTPPPSLPLLPPLLPPPLLPPVPPPPPLLPPVPPPPPLLPPVPPPPPSAIPTPPTSSGILPIPTSPATSSRTPPPAAAASASRTPPPPQFLPRSNSTQNATSSGQRPGRQTDGQSTTAESNSRTSKTHSRKRRAVWISIVVVVSFIVLLLAIVMFVPRYRKRRGELYRILKRHEIAPYTGTRENPREMHLSVVSRQDSQDEEIAPPVGAVRPKEENVRKILGPIPKQRKKEEVTKPISAVPRRIYHEIDMSGSDMDIIPPPPPPPLPLSPSPSPSPRAPSPVEEVKVAPVVTTRSTAAKSLPVHFPTTSVKSCTIASLHQYTNSFSHDNLIGGGMLGNVYRAELPDGTFLAIKKLDRRVAIQLKDDQFIDLVNDLDRIRHANVVQLLGYCSEHDQKLLVYEYCTNGTLQEALHSDDGLKINLPWITRIRIALGAARALEYLHEICEPPIIHRNVKSANVLLDNELSVLVSDCGLAPLISSGVVSQLSGQLLTTYGYGAPEFESRVYTTKSDVYSFGVVMLELLTGRMSYDRSRSRGEQILVRWAIPQLHDIDALTRMVDPALDGKYLVKSLSHFSDIISRCVLAEAEYRPQMSEVVHDLTQLIHRESSSTSGRSARNFHHAS